MAAARSVKRRVCSTPFRLTRRTRLQGGVLVVHFTTGRMRHFLFPPDQGHDRVRPTAATVEGDGPDFLSRVVEAPTTDFGL
jgi:hypothetical protein